MTQPTSTYPPPTGWAPPGWGAPAGPAWGQNPGPAPAKRKTGRYILGAIGLFLAGAAFSAANDTTTSTGGVENVAAGNGSASSSMTVWASRYGGPDAAMLGADLTAITDAARTMDTTTMLSSCRTFQRHINSASAHLPTPDAQLTTALTSAYTYFGQANTACILGISSMDPDELGKMSTYVQLGTASLEAATARVNALN